MSSPASLLASLPPQQRAKILAEFTAAERAAKPKRKPPVRRKKAEAVEASAAEETTSELGGEAAE